MAVTIRDVSKACGLSVSAVSKALNNYSDISAETRERVQRMAKEMGYRTNALARGLKTNHTYNLGVILDDEMRAGLQHAYFSTMLGGFAREAETLGYDITLLNCGIGKEPMTYLEHSRYRNVDGVCLMCVDIYSLEVSELVQSDVKVVSIDHVFSGRDCVLSDNKSGMRQLTEYVLSMGHRRVAMICGNHSSVTDARVGGFYEVMHEHGIEQSPEYMVNSHYNSTHHSREAAGALLALPNPPTCIMMTDDFSALGGMEGIQQAGLRVPEDVSVTGFDGTSLIQRIHPRLTTVRQHGEEIGRQAALRLIERIENPALPVRRPQVIPCDLLRGETVAPVSDSNQ